ncbi:DUF411 domain-containing protein [Phyllobacterium zundukense]|uniref:DUF411 domain-containing protein n=1 Tax=Phyllobacterium zundukense TaxID=1867719 RepID=A0ACD4CYB0_9HYPH|nr:DUF411 domain-containing protein [Phyllobacterium zundukense]UXN58443.1 DUF411 domain-containing protein [Phyllobacterium zundukense]
MERREFIGTGIAAMAAVVVARNAGAGTHWSMTVYKDPNCGCCNLWSMAMENAGFTVERVDTNDLPGVKKRFGVPASVEGCHTAVVGGYFLDGHVPLEAVAKLLYERPDIAGLAVPGMPVGSLGMDYDPNASFDVYAVAKGPEQKTSVYYEVRPRN